MQQGWVPNQHGAWAMLVMPWLLGVLWAIGEGRFGVEHVALFAFWMVGYFAFFAVCLWLKSRFKRRYLRATLTYSAVAALLGIGVLVLRPHWWTWALVYVPVLCFALWLSYLRHERDVASGLATISAACLLPLVMGSQGLFHIGGMPVLAGLALVCFGYFFGTVLYVKTVLRERGKRWWVVASVAWHAACAVAAAWAPAPLPRWWLVAFFVAVGSRALLVPALGPMRGRKVDVKLVGIWEFSTSVVLLVIVAPALLG